MPAIAEALRGVFSSDGFVPRRVCGLWPDWLVWEHVAGNALIWLAYVAIPILIWRLGRRLPSMAPYRELAAAFGVFIGFCGLGHFLDMLAFFRPMYRLSGHVLIATGAASWWTAWAIRRAWPSLAAMRSPAELERVILERTAELTRALDEMGRLQEERDRLSTIVESSDDAIIGKDLDGSITSWNAGAERLFGYSAAEALGRPITFLMPPDRLEEESAILGELRAGRRVSHFESVRRTRSGSDIEVSLTISPILGRDGRVVGISKIARDITARRRVEEAVRESEARFRQLADAMPQIVWTTRPDGRVDYWNERWYEFTGLPRAFGGHETWTSVLHPDDLERTLEAWDRAVGEGSPYEIEYRFRDHRSGEYRWQLARGLPVKDGGGRVVRWIGTCTDIEDQKRAEEALRASERIYRAVGESIPFGIWICDPEGRNTYVSESLLRLVGLDQERCSRFGWGEVLHPEDAERALRAWSECVRTEGNWDIEHRFRGVDGRWHPILARGVPVRDDSGRILCWAGINLDIGRLKAAEEALRESEERQRRALTAARLAHWEWDVQADRISYHDSLPLLYGRPEDRPFADFEEYLTVVHPEDRESVRQAARRAEAPGVPYEVEYRVVWPDGSTRWVDSRGGTDFDPQGRPTRMVGVNLDITDRKRAETQIRQLNDGLELRVQERTADLARANRALLESEASMREAQRLAGVGSWEWDVVSDAVTWSDELYRIAGRDPAGPAPRFLEHDRLYTPESLAQLRSVVQKSLESGDPYEVELELIAGEAGHRWVIGRGEATRDARGRVARLRGTVQDVTERREQREQLRRARDQAMAATRAKGAFLANMSHEIRTPMNGVLGMADLLLDTGLDGTQRDYASAIRDSGEALLTIINDILDLSKIEAGKMSLDVAPFDLRGILGEVAQLLEPSARQKCIRLVEEVEPAVPARLLGDATRVRQVLTNLVGNAVKFTDHGEVAVRAELLGVTPAGARLRISVRDTGIGIAPEDQPGIFESFAQVEGNPARKHGGTGLGLSIVRTLVGLMGGEVGLESTPGFGSTFRVELSLPVDPSVPDPAEPEVPAGRGPLGGPILILLAEDNRINRVVARRMIERMGASVDEATNGLEAVEASGRRPYDLVLMDVQMPVMDGLAATAAIRRREALGGRRVPIIALTANAMRDDRGRCLEAGMDDYLSKPIRPQHLGEAIRRWIRLDARPPGEPPPAFDLGLVSEWSGGDPEIIAGILEAFLESAPEELRGIRAALEAHDSPALRIGALRLKESCQGIGAASMAEACDAILGQEPGIGTAADRLQADWARLEAEINRHLHAVPTA